MGKELTPEGIIMNTNIDICIIAKKSIDLTKDLLPADDLKLYDSEIDLKKIEIISSQINDILTNPQDLLFQIFKLEFPIKINLVLTSGAPAPFDAWTKYFDDQDWIFFNLSQWTVECLKKHFKSIFKHELSHILIRPYFKTDFSDALENLKFIVLDEGIAHFIAAMDENPNLIELNINKRFKVIAELNTSIDTLLNPSTTDDDKTNLLIKANTGPYWEKYGALAGMFWVYQIYKSQGIAGIQNLLNPNTIKNREKIPFLTKFE